ncbi:MAG: M1 family metallopeptidase [Bacteroidota bacterium]
MKKITLLFLVAYSQLLFAQKYFQQEVNYKIDVRLNDKDHALHAFETFEYTNNSPNELLELYIHIWPNAYKNNNTALAKQLTENKELAFYYSKPEERGFIDSLDFKVNGAKVAWEYDAKNIDICKIILPSPLVPGGKITVSTPFYVKIPSGEFSRLGHIEQQYQITQWYPKPAVYDARGWNAMPYLDQGEFYSEFGSFDVSITLPENYVLGATGDLQNAEEIEWLTKKAKETEAKTEFDVKDNKFPESSSKTKTLHFIQSNVHDFAWFCDKRYHVLKGEVELPQSKRKVTTWAMFTNQYAKLWKKSLPYLHDATYYYSLWNGDYPYNHITAVDGALSAGGGMEYPNITVIGGVGDDFSLETVIMHEAGHNWFYGILGSNEREYAWMDEGINSLNELRYIQTKYPDKKLVGNFATKKLAKTLDINNYFQRSQYYLMYLFNARKNEDQACQIHSADYTNFNYGAIVYSKTATLFYYLKEYLGEEKFDSIMHQYFETWKFKHPQPEDIREVFEKETGKELSWFFNDLIGTTKKLDYKIIKAGVNKKGDNYLVIKNTQKVRGPFSVSGFKDGKRTASMWFEGFNGKQEFAFVPGEFDKYVIDYSEDMPEFNRKNNNYNAKKLFKKVEPIRFQFLSSIENGNRTQVCFTPVVGWNNYDKTMLGLAFYNTSIPQKKFEYLLMPMFSLNTKDINGIYNIAYNIFPQTNIKKNAVQRFTASLSVKKFNEEFSSDILNNKIYNSFIKIQPKIEIESKKKFARSTKKEIITIRNVSIIRGNRPNIEMPSLIVSDSSYNYLVNEIKYRFSNQKPINPYSFEFNFQIGLLKSFAKVFTEFNYKISYPKSKKGTNIRLFAGKFISPSANPYFGFAMSGNTDYLYDYTLLARSRDAAWLQNNQVINNDGAFKNITTNTPSTNWLTALNLSIDIPKVPLAVYADLGLSSTSNKAMVYNTGVAVKIIPNVFEVYFPAVMSSNLNMLSYGEKIRIALHINAANPFNLLKNASL